MDKEELAARWVAWLDRVIPRRVKPRDRDDVRSRALALAWYCYVRYSQKPGQEHYGPDSWIANAFRSATSRRGRDCPGSRIGRGPRYCPVAACRTRPFTFDNGDEVEHGRVGDRPELLAIARETAARLAGPEGSDTALVVHAKIAGMSKREIVALGILTHYRVERAMVALSNTPI